MRCRASTKDKLQCKNTALANKKYCAVHSESLHLDKLIVPVASALIGFAAIPTLGSAIVAGAIGSLIENNFKRKTKIFVSFDFHNDRRLKTLIINQANDARSNFEVIDTSLVEAALEHQWEKKAEALIKKADIILVIVGEHTHTANGVLKEIEMANRHRKKIIQILGSKKMVCKSIKGAGRVYKWTWPNLTKLLN